MSSSSSTPGNPPSRNPPEPLTSTQPPQLTSLPFQHHQPPTTTPQPLGPLSYISPTHHQAFVCPHTLPPLSPIEQTILADDLITAVTSSDAFLLDLYYDRFYTVEELLGAWNRSFGMSITMGKFRGMIENAEVKGVLKRMEREGEGEREGEVERERWCVGVL
jgi:hypothetical protein